MPSMPTSKLAKWFVQEIVIGFGFFTGFWLFVGVDPEALIVNSFLEVLRTFSSSIASTLSFSYWLLGAVFIVISIALSYCIGKWAGLMAVVLAFFGGLLIMSVGAYLLLIGVCVGFIAPFLNQNKDSGYSYY